MQVRQFVAGFRASGRRLDVLVCNAAIYQPTAKAPSFTADGRESSQGLRRRPLLQLVCATDSSCDVAHLCCLSPRVVASSQCHACTGFEISTGTNHLGHFLLANMLLEDIQVCCVPAIAGVSSVHKRCMPCSWLARRMLGIGTSSC